MNLKKSIEASILHDLPAYTVRTSPRARRCYIKVSPLGQVEVILAKGVQDAYAHQFIRRHRDWVRKKLDKYADMRLEPHLTSTVPDRVKLAFANQDWAVKARLNQEKTCIVEAQSDSMLHLFFQTEQRAQRVLNLWLQRKAQAVLPAYLTSISKEIGLPYARATVRRQTTRWGSCSSAKSINLNRNLVFLPSDLVRYLCVHELCHTVHMNHSKSFWRLVHSFEPNYEKLDRELNTANRFVPMWAFEAK